MSDKRKENLSYKEKGEAILKLVGGSDNVTGLTNCMTRLRFRLKDSLLFNVKALEELSYVLGAVKNDNEFQVIIGADVENFFQAIQSMLKDNTPEVEEKNTSIGNKLIDTLSGIFTPIIPALTAAGMLQALLALLVTFKVISADTQTYQILSFMGNTAFYFLPILIANSAAKKFKCNHYLAMMLGAMLLHPDFIGMVANSMESGVDINFIGIPVYNATYSSSVIPIILGVWVMSKVDPLVDRISPKPVKFFMRPMLTFLITGILTLVALGPIGYIVAVWISDGINMLNNIAGWIVPTVIGATLPLMVMTGVHHGLIPIAINNMATIGYDSMIFPGQLASNVAQGAAGFAVSLKAKDSQIKQMASATSFTAMCGITEPILYGVTMNVKTNLIATMVGGAVSGFFFGIFNVKNYLFAAPGLLTLTGYINESAGMNNFYLVIVGTLLGALVSFTLAFILYKDKSKDEKEIIHLNTVKNK
ncbi:PTS system beta-glucosides-specific IIC component [Breznakia blatticola]|uniref:PTS system beta-glucosides-specific IIC component n=1 Tax=Breznakia blatticola TaxID=1754012 RepID=A0A4R7ZA36_9FIRM|nr:PTS transporter subunit EIIC [Breznakia blatticola]TDW08634.1 PTS system beta-glucosides-specific IIC component [Breznakia blatticola]